jgi:ParB family chromosome partitioning protein
MKKQPMAEAAEQLFAETGWLPALMRTPQPDAERNEGETFPLAAE